MSALPTTQGEQTEAIDTDWRRPIVRSHKSGAHPHLTPRIAAAIVQSVQACNKRIDAARAVGVSSDVLRVWLKKGRTHKGGIYRDFADSLDTAEAEAKERLVNIIAAAADDSPEHAKWMLERKYPAEWAPQVRLVVDNELNTALDAIQGVVDADTFDKIIDALQARGAGSGAPTPAVIDAAGLLLVDPRRQPALLTPAASAPDLRPSPGGSDENDQH